MGCSFSFRRLRVDAGIWNVDGGGLDLADLGCGGVAVDDDLLHHDLDFGVEVPEAEGVTVALSAVEVAGSFPSASAVRSDSINSAAVPNSTSRSSSARI